MTEQQIRFDDGAFTELIFNRFAPTGSGSRRRPARLPSLTQSGHGPSETRKLCVPSDEPSLYRRPCGVIGGSLNVRFAPKAIERLRHRELSQRATGRRRLEFS